MREDGLLVPRRRGQGQIEWVQAAYSAVHDMLTNPTYAGAYAFGRRQSQRRVGEDGRARVSKVPMPRERWHTLIFEHHEAYITFEQHEQILDQITRNAAHPGRGRRRARRAGAAPGSCALRALRAADALGLLRRPQPPRLRAALLLRPARGGDRIQRARRERVPGTRRTPAR